MQQTDKTDTTTHNTGMGRLMCKHVRVIACYISEVWELERFATAIVTFIVIQGQRCWCSSLNRIPYSISVR